MFDALSERRLRRLAAAHALKQMEQAGQHEMLNWMALDRRDGSARSQQPVVHDYAETHIFMSDKCFVILSGVNRCRVGRDGDGNIPLPSCSAQSNPGRQCLGIRNCLLDDVQQ